MAWGRGDEATDNLSAVQGTTCCYVSTRVRVFGKVTVMCCSERTVYLQLRVILFAHFVAQHKVTKITKEIISSILKIT